MAKFYGVKDKEDVGGAEMKQNQTKEDALKVFFSVNEKEPSKANAVIFV